MGFNTSEYVDQLTLVLLSIFTPGQPPPVKYDFASYIADKIHDQFMRFENERVFKYSSVIYHLMIYFQSENSLFVLRNLMPKGILGQSSFGLPLLTIPLILLIPIMSLSTFLFILQLPC